MFGSNSSLCFRALVASATPHVVTDQKDVTFSFTSRCRFLVVDVNFGLWVIGLCFF